MPSDGAVDDLSQQEGSIGRSQQEGSIVYREYENETQIYGIIRLIEKDLSEPYSIFTYRYFINNWPKLCYLAIDTSQDDKCVGAIVCKLDVHKVSCRSIFVQGGIGYGSCAWQSQQTYRGYIAMLAVDEQYRKMGIGTRLVRSTLEAMISQNCEEVVLETEESNKGALRLYEQLGFMRDKRLHRYYLNGGDAFRLKLRLC